MFLSLEYKITNILNFQRVLSQYESNNTIYNYLFYKIYERDTNICEFTGVSLKSKILNVLVLRKRTVYESLSLR